MRYVCMFRNTNKFVCKYGPGLKPASHLQAAQIWYSKGEAESFARRFNLYVQPIMGD